MLMKNYWRSMVMVDWWLGWMLFWFSFIIGTLILGSLLAGYVGSLEE